MLEMVFIKNILYLCFVFWKVKMRSVDVLNYFVDYNRLLIGIIFLILFCLIVYNI